MSDAPETPTSSTAAPRKRRAAVGRPAGAPTPIEETAAVETAEAAPAKKAPAKKTAAKKAPAKKTAAKAAPAADEAPAEESAAPAKRTRRRVTSDDLFLAAPEKAAPAKKASKATAAAPADEVADEDSEEETDETTDAAEPAETDEAGEESDEAADGEGADGDAPARRRRRRRGGRGRNRNRSQQGGDDDSEGDSEDGDAEASSSNEGGNGGGNGGNGAGGTARTRKRRRAGEGAEGGDGGDAANVVVRVREPRSEQVRGVQGSTRLEAKRQRRKDNRDAPRRRQPLLTEAEFLARRESVERVMLVRQQGEKTQIAVLENGVLAEHYVTRASTSSYAGNVYLGKVQNVLPSMEAAFVDIGKGRNAVLYAGEVNYDLSGLDSKPQRIEQVLASGQDVLVQVTKDPIGHKGARLTSQVSLPGRYVVYVPGGSSHGISRKLPDTERSRLKSILKRVVPEDAGVIVRTAAEGASEEELERDVNRLAAQWADIQAKTKKAKAPALLYSEPDLVVRVIRDIFNEDVKQLIVQGDSEAHTIEGYVGHVAPDLAARVSRWNDDEDIFAAHRVDEQLQKALSTKVHLPSGGYLIIERTEAMTVIDVNTGKFVGKGGNLEETVTKNNLEAAEEVVRQLRLRDVGGIIVIDFVDMVLESNRDLVLRRLVECLGRDRTKHNVAEVTSLGLVQMTRKRVGQGLLEAFSTTCEHCGGRGHVLTTDSPEATPRKKGKGIPAAMRPKAHDADSAALAPVQDADAESVDGSADGAEDPSEESLAEAVAEAAVEDLTESVELGDDDPDADDANDEDDDADDADDDEDALNEATVGACD